MIESFLNYLDSLPVGAQPILIIAIILGVPFITAACFPLALGFLAGFAGYKAHKWWKHNRFKDVQPIDRKFLIEWYGFEYQTKMDGHDYMCVGMSNQGTIRWWYDPDLHRLVPQAVDDGKIYWDKEIAVDNQVWRKHLDGFYEMGNEWPEYYKTVIAPTEKKKKKKKNKIKDIPVRPETPEEKAERESFYPTAQPIGKTVAASPVLQLIQTVNDLEKEVNETKCPTMDFSFMDEEE